MPRRITLSLALAVLLVLLLAGQALAHQPFFEDQDFTRCNPYVVANPDISTAVYSTLETPDDVDYFTFQGHKGQRILLNIEIPLFCEAEQPCFCPTMALIGPRQEAQACLGPAISLPFRPVQVFLPPPGAPTIFFEPFTQTSYWDRQKDYVTLPADGQYEVAVWSPQRQVGRYVFVIGEEEVIGGDPAYREKLPTYFTPVPQPSCVSWWPAWPNTCTPGACPAS